MEKNICDFFFSAFVVFHREIGLLVIILLILWLMSGRRPNPWTYTGAFVKTLVFVFKKSVKICELAAKETAAVLPTKYAKWRPLIRLVLHPAYCILVFATIAVVISSCAH